jgi:hypothetical protein
MSKKEQFLIVLHNTDFEWGFEARTDVFLNNELIRDSEGTMKWLSELFKESYDNVTITEGILRTLAHMGLDQVGQKGVDIVAAGLKHPNICVKDAAVHCFENWRESDHIPYLQQVHFDEEWMQRYVEQVIKDLERYK